MNLYQVYAKKRYAECFFYVVADCFASAEKTAIEERYGDIDAIYKIELVSKDVYVQASGKEFEGEEISAIDDIDDDIPF